MFIALLTISGYICGIIPLFTFLIYNAIRWIYGFFGWGTYENVVMATLINPWVVAVLWSIALIIFLRKYIGAAWLLVLLLMVIVIGAAFIIYGQLIPGFMAAT